MSDDLLRTARQLLAELDASEAYLRSIAIEALPYPKVMAVERRAGRRCAQLLAGLGGTAFELITLDDVTDELLTGRVRHGDPAGKGALVNEPAIQSHGPQNRGPLAAPQSVGAYEPFDDGPEGAADNGNDPRSEEEPPRPVADADTAEVAVQAPPPVASSGFVTFDDKFSIKPGASDLDDEPTITAKWVDPGKGGKRGTSSDDPFGNLVTFGDPVSATPETVVRSHGPTPKGAASRSSTPGAEGLVTMDDKPSDSLASALAGDGPETFDLIPDLSEEDLAGFEDEEVTVVRTGDSASWDVQASAKKANSPASAPRQDQRDRQPQLQSGNPSNDRVGESARGSASEPARARGTLVPSAAAVSTSPPVSASTPARLPVAPLKSSPAAEPADGLSAIASVGAPQAKPPASSVRVLPPGPTSPGPASGQGLSTQGTSAQGLSAPSALGAGASGPGASGRPVAPSVAPPKAPAVRVAPSTTTSVPPGKPQPGLLPKVNAGSQLGKATPPPSAGSASARVTAGLYGGGSVPTIRDSDEPRPRAAAIQLNASGSGARVLGMEEEEEPIEIGEAEEDEGTETGGFGGFSVKLQRYEDTDEEDEEDLELSEEDLEVIQPAQVVPAGPTPEEIRAMLQRAVNAAAAGDLQGGADLYSDVIDADPDNVTAHVARGRLFLDLGDYSRAMSDFMVGEDIAPNDPEPQVAIGDLYFARKDYRKAIDYFNAALEVSPNHAMAYCRRGISHYYRKNYKEAVDDLLKAERLDREIPNIQTYVSMARKKVKR